VLVCALDGAPYIVSPAIDGGDEGRWKVHFQACKKGPDGWKAQNVNQRGVPTPVGGLSR
jgi:hypothetical protein